MPKIRTPNNGPEVRGNSAGDVLIWDGLEWRPGPLDFDFVLRSLQDLENVVQPIGGVFSLPSGSYAVAESFALGPGQTIEIDGRVLLAGLGPNVVLGFDAGPAIFIGALAEVEIDGLRLASTAGTLIVNTGQLTTRAVLASSVGIAFRQAGAGRWVDVGSRLLSSNDNTISAEAGSMALVGTVSTATAFRAFNANVATAMEVTLSNCKFFGATQCAQLLNPLLVFSSSNSRFESSNASAVGIAVAAADMVQINGGVIRTTNATPGHGVSITGDVDAFAVVGTFFRTCNRAVSWAAGVVAKASLVGLQSDALTQGVRWPAANIPAQGLLVQACQFDTASAFVNFVATDPRVNVKGCSGSGGLLPETPIVP